MRRVPPARLIHLYRAHFAPVRRELLFLSGLSFGVTFGVTRAITRLQFHGNSPVGSVKWNGVHIHHQVFGILMLVGTGHAWLHLSSTKRRDDRNLLRLNTVVYGAGCALTLDEVALWLNLEDVYWRSPWRELIDAGIIAGSVVSIGVWGAPFFRGILREGFPTPHRHQSNHDTEDQSGPTTRGADAAAQAALEQSQQAGAHALAVAEEEMRTELVD